MKIQINKLTPTLAKFTLSDTQISFANSLRRILLSEIPTLSIDLVEIKKNCTVLPDEMIAHRLGLIPFNSNTNLLYKEDCDCLTSCTKCAINGSIKVSNEGNDVMTVTSRDIKFVDDTGMNDYFLTLRNPVVIIKLSNGHSLEANLVVRKGIAQTHSKYSPVTVVGFSYDENNRLRHTDYWYEDDKNKEWPGLNEEEAIIGECNTVNMEFETVEGVLEAKTVLIKGLEILKNKVDDLLSAVEKYEHIN